MWIYVFNSMDHSSKVYEMHSFFKREKISEKYIAYLFERYISINMKTCLLRNEYRHGLRCPIYWLWVTRHQWNIAHSTLIPDYYETIDQERDIRSGISPSIRPGTSQRAANMALPEGAGRTGA